MNEKNKINFNDLDRTKKYLNGRAYFINYDGREVMYFDMSNLEGDDFYKFIKSIDEFTENVILPHKEALSVIDIRGTRIDPRTVSLIKKHAKKITAKATKKQAIFGVNRAHKFYINLMRQLGKMDMKAFDTKEECLVWITKD